MPLKSFNTNFNRGQHETAFLASNILRRALDLGLDPSIRVSVESNLQVVGDQLILFSLERILRTTNCVYSCLNSNNGVRLHIWEILLLNHRCMEKRTQSLISMLGSALQTNLRLHKSRRWSLGKNNVVQAWCSKHEARGHAN